MERTVDVSGADGRATALVTERIDERTIGRAPAGPGPGVERLQPVRVHRPVTAGTGLVRARRRARTVGLTYQPSLDGLRALAVTAVVIYHAGIGWLPGGFLGVEVFFVISGYLITSLLLSEHRRSGTVSLRLFWVRRARRLLPALYLLLLVTSIWWLLFLRGEVQQVRGDVVAALTYVTNWWLVFSKQSYFAEAGRPSPFRHLWSLAVEEQFYLVWPLLFGLLMAVTRGVRRKAVGVLGVGALVSAALMLLLYTPASDPSRPYYGTDTRGSGLLIGAALAFLVPPWRLTRRTGRGAGVVIDAVAALTLAGLGWFFLRVNEFDPFVYRRGFLLLDLLTAVAIIAVIHPAGRLPRWLLSRRPVLWVGQRSYGIYLWHWPVFVLTRPHIDIGLSGMPLLALRLALTLGLAELSYRFVEQPVRHGAIGAAWRRVRSPYGRPAGTRRRAALSLSAVLMIVGAVAVGLAASSTRHGSVPPGLEHVSADDTIPPPTAPGAQSPTSAVPPGSPVAPVPTPTQPPPAPVPTTAPPSARARATTTTAPLPAPTTAPTTTAVTPTVEGAPVPAADVTAIGDSVLLGGRSAVQSRLSGVYVNAAVGRQWQEAPGIASALAKAGYLRPVVIVHLGTNGAVTGELLDTLLAELGGRRVLLVNTRVDRPWETLVNRRLADAAARHPNAVLVDWFGASNGHSDYFVNDGVHLTKSGAAAYADLIARNLR